LDILNVINGNTLSSSKGGPDGGLSALDILKAEQDQPFIVTFSSKVDEMLNGGVPVGKITEFCGAPGIGKTQFRWDH
jgi:RAD51-like protein 2